MKFLMVISLVLCASFATAEVLKLENAELQKRIDANDSKLVIIDIRDPQEYATGHVRGAINIPHTQIINDSSILKPYHSAEVVLYCRSGARTTRTLEYIDSEKFNALYHLKGDMLGWNAKKLPLER